ncbi:hypothetical protein BX616_002929 [Lobosporangium transversale]|uniref:Uncharacterized protein n=1 Tax=Lobosporangium transversale TaxID=64571 RepID=A0A1Y2H1G7_9FUNG|nr:hypothetical protein BCR41DRAFT_367038 [Lobosporangium transversale]KAF9916751.1 hypothetical protein BX616_002929 [Lobosporangium transversale]ORZ28399.1 hypothetical protein BCR41DRAFT_367038 [Lobosporangium transversale]|eukprot:XP_021886084.1 hypothetical protein BCR41DRAFT_367038 [Lobosporangium transversale]
MPSSLLLSQKIIGAFFLSIVIFPHIVKANTINNLTPPSSTSLSPTFIHDTYNNQRRHLLGSLISLLPSDGSQQQLPEPLTAPQSSSGSELPASSLAAASPSPSPTTSSLIDGILVPPFFGHDNSPDSEDDPSTSSTIPISTSAVADTPSTTAIEKPSSSLSPGKHIPVDAESSGTLNYDHSNIESSPPDEGPATTGNTTVSNVDASADDQSQQIKVALSSGLIVFVIIVAIGVILAVAFSCYRIQQSRCLRHQSWGEDFLKDHAGSVGYSESAGYGMYISSNGNKGKSNFWRKTLGMLRRS